MKKFFIIFLLPLFLGGGPVNPQSVTFQCPCEDTADTLPNDTMRGIMAPIIAQPVDSFREAKQDQLDSINDLRDSLTIEVRRLKREKGKVLIVGHTDTIPGQIWKWTYWKYPDGTKQFYKVFKYKTK
jgi:hypothetical protein